MFDRLRNMAGVMRPRSLARVAAHVQRLDAEMPAALERIAKDLADMRRRAEHDRETHTRNAERDRETLEQHTRSAAGVSKEIAALASSIGGLTNTMASMQDALQKVHLRTEQLTAIQRADEDDEESLEQLPAVLERDRACAHARRAVETSELHADPFPHMIIDDLLPDDLYNAMIRAIPPRVLFEDRRVNKQQLRVPPSFAPAFSRRVWPFIAGEVIVGALKPGIVARFREPLTEYLQRFWPGQTADEARLPLSASDGRIILRRPGYVIPPHRDPRWGFLTVIMYLVRPNDPDTWGTQLFRVREDVNAPSAQPYWISGAHCELVKDVPFRRNRALVFLNSDGAHGASLPEDAPADFERYIYQWRIGPHGAVMRDLLARLTPATRSAWEGKEGY